MDVYEVELFRKAVASDPRHLTPLDVVKKINSGEAMLWRLEREKTRALFVVYIMEEFGVRELFVWLLAGVGLWRMFKELSESFNKIAGFLGCDYISCGVVNENVAAPLRKLGFVEVSRLMSRRV